jgi:hypothetical protein
MPLVFCKVYSRLTACVRQLGSPFDLGINLLKNQGKLYECLPISGGLILLAGSLLPWFVEWILLGIDGLLLGGNLLGLNGILLGGSLLWFDGLIFGVSLPRLNWILFGGSLLGLLLGGSLFWLDGLLFGGINGLLLGGSLFWLDGLLFGGRLSWLNGLLLLGLLLSDIILELGLDCLLLNSSLPNICHYFLYMKLIYFVKGYFIHSSLLDSVVKTPPADIDIKTIAVNIIKLSTTVR